MTDKNDNYRIGGIDALYSLSAEISTYGINELYICIQNLIDFLLNYENFP